MRFRKKPVEVEAVRWFRNGDHPDDYLSDQEGFGDDMNLHTFTGAERKTRKWEGEVVRYFRRPDIDGRRKCEKCHRTMHEHGWIDTLEGGHIVCPGDWIITGVEGEHYPCKPSVFEATYDPLPQPDQESK